MNHFLAARIKLLLAAVLGLFPMLGKTASATFPLDSARGRQSLEKPGATSARPNVVIFLADDPVGATRG